MSHDILSEAERVKGFLKSLGLFSDDSGEEKDPKAESKAEKKAKDIVETILRQLKLKYHFQRIKGTDGIVFRHQITIDKEHYVVKSYIGLDTEHMGVVLWSENEDDYLQVIAVGYLKDSHAMIAVGKQRLKSWMESEKKYGSTSAE